MSVCFDDQQEAAFQKLLRRYDEGDSRVLPGLTFAQETFGAISPEVEAYMARRLGVSLAQLHQIATFYHMFHDVPCGRHLLTVCSSISCRLAGADDLLNHIKRRLNIAHAQTTDDGLFTLEVVECLGACHQAPALQVNGEFHGPMTRAKTDELLDRLAGGRERR